MKPINLQAEHSFHRFSPIASKHGRIGFLSLVFLLCFHTAAMLEAQTVRRALALDQPSLNDTARLLAGLQPIDPGVAGDLAQAPFWQEHARAIGKEWEGFASRNWRSIRAWSGHELSWAGEAGGAVFYPFSGPDFIYVYNYFPRANAYLLCGLEPVGEMPEITRLDAAALEGLRNSLQTLLSAGYFVTKTMRMELRGTLPLMLLMLARSGCTITTLERSGNCVDIHFIAGSGGGERHLVYLCTDLSNGGFGKGMLMSWIKQLQPRSGYIKSASFLLHQNSFSKIRELLLSQCRLIVQDDSGIPIRYFPSSNWTLRLYGTYSPPLNIFREYYQPDLAALYARTPTKPLSFGVGYRFNPAQATLIVATAK